MADSTLAPPLDNNDDDVTEIINDLDKIIENVELISGGAPRPAYLLLSLSFVYVYNSQKIDDSVLCPSVVQLTWMAYDMVLLRTNPELEASMRLLQEAYQRCRSVILTGKEPQMDSNL